MKALVPSPSSSSSSSSEVVSPDGKCQICRQPGHGFHFGAFTCRACAAFFRRCHFSPNPEPKCRFHIERCGPSSGRWSCKKCRLDRCLELGMTPTNIQYDRDAFKSSVSYVKSRSVTKKIGDRIGVPLTVEKALGVPHLIAFLGKRDRGETGDVAFIDITGLVEMSMQEVLKPTLSRRSKKMSNLLQLAQGLDDYHACQMENLTELQLITHEEQAMEWKRGLMSAAKWLNYSDTIRQLDSDSKALLLKTTWFVWSRLERIAMTAKMRVNGRCGKRQFVLSHKSLVDYDRLSTDISWWTSHSFHELRFFFEPSEVFYDEIINEIIEVQPDSVELAFLLSVICFHMIGMRSREKTETLTDNLHDGLANDLHEYYQSNNKPMYLLRLKQLMRIKEHFLVLCLKRYEKYAIGGCFNMFQMRFSHPEFFAVPC